MRIKQVRRSTRVKQTRYTRPVDPQGVAVALGATSTDQHVVTRQGPAAVFALRQALVEQLMSTGGRPGLGDASRRQKIPLNDEDWARLQTLARLVADQSVRPTAGQVASILLRKAIEAVDVAQVKDALRQPVRRA